MFRRRDRPLHP